MDELSKTRIQPGKSGADQEVSNVHPAVGTVTFIETSHVPPCPHCGKPLTTIYKNVSKGWQQTDVMYSCAACGRLVGIGYSRHG